MFIFNSSHQGKEVQNIVFFLAKITEKKKYQTKILSDKLYQGLQNYLHVLNN